MIVAFKRLAGLYRKLMANGVLAAKPKLRMKMLSHIANGQPMKFNKSEYHAIRVASQKFTIEKVMTPTVSLKTKFVPNKWTQTMGPMHIAEHKRVPMIDVDLPNALAHQSLQVKSKTKGEFMKKLDDYLETPAGQSSVFDLYDTPAGVRAWDMGVRAGPISYDKTAQVLGSDPLYRMFSMRRGSFASRLSPKPGREGDFVAQKFASNYGPGTVNPTNRMEIDRYHDGIIKRILNTDNPASMDELTSLLDIAYSKGL